MVGTAISGTRPTPAVGAELAVVLAAAFPWTAGSEITAVTVADWGAEEFIGGAFTSPTPGRAAHSAMWARPWAGRVFFAGEATSPARGVGRVHGALGSGFRAATELVAALARPTALPFPAPAPVDVRQSDRYSDHFAGR